MKSSETLLKLSKFLKRAVVYLAVSDLKPEQLMTFSVFARNFRTWSGRNPSDFMLDFSLHKLTEAKLITRTGSLATDDLSIAPTMLGVALAQEAYLLAEAGADDFADLLPKQATAVSPDPNTKGSSGLFHVRSLDARPIINALSN